MDKKAKNFIFTVDDFGISPKANANMLRLLPLGIIDRIAVLIHGSITDEEAAKLLSSGVKLDIHLDRRDSIDPDRKLADGALRRIVVFLWNVLFGDMRPRVIEKRWEAQMELFRARFGSYPDGIDSHEHVHLFPPYFRVAVRIAKKYHATFIRFGAHSYMCRKPVSFILDVLKRVDRGTFRTSGIPSTDLLVSFDWIADYDAFLKSHSGEATVEIVFHPERDDEMAFLEHRALR
jgi:predicted glycoside hydrolase/deacetylase ChbG (UPF0249 family)